MRWWCTRSSSFPSLLLGALVLWRANLSFTHVMARTLGRRVSQRRDSHDQRVFCHPVALFEGGAMRTSDSLTHISRVVALTRGTRRCPAHQQRRTTRTGPTTGADTCGLSGVAFCDTFEQPYTRDARSGRLDPSPWSVARVTGTNNQGQGQSTSSCPARRCAVGTRSRA